MLNIAEYQFSFSELDFQSRLVIAEMQTLCINYEKRFPSARYPEHHYRTVTLNAPVGTTLLSSHNFPDEAARLLMVFRGDATGCFPTSGSKCALPLAMLLVLGDSCDLSLSVSFMGDGPAASTLTLAAQIALQEIPDLSCPAWFPASSFEAAVVRVRVPEHMDFRS